MDLTTATCKCVLLSLYHTDNQVYSHEYDAYYCNGCNTWLEEVCEDQTCELCKTRPALPMSPKIASSPDRHTFQKDSMIQRHLANGASVNDPEIQLILAMYNKSVIQEADNIADPSWQRNNMEFDMRACAWMVEKVQESKVYAQHLYAALCNNDFQELEMWPILKDDRWSCSWRHAGGIVADMRGTGDYIDWYCSGIRTEDTDMEPEQWDNLTIEQQISYKEGNAFVHEGIITDEIMEDLRKMGWIFREGDHDPTVIK